MVSRQEQYRKRVLLKARYFEESDRRRRASLRGAQPFGDWPEVRKVWGFFEAHPRATFVPTILVDDGWDVSCDRDADPDADFHLALAYVALKEISGLPVTATLVTDSGTGVLDDEHPEVVSVRRELAELRDAGMWVAE
jgi:hypothetical protein